MILVKCHLRFVTKLFFFFYVFQSWRTTSSILKLFFCLDGGGVYSTLKVKAIVLYSNRWGREEEQKEVCKSRLFNKRLE